MTNTELAVDKLFSDWVQADAIAQRLLQSNRAPSAPRCELHDIRLEAPCERCGEKVCAECSGAAGAALCGACDELNYQQEHARRARRANTIGILGGLAVLGVALAIFFLR